MIRRGVSPLTNTAGSSRASVEVTGNPSRVATTGRGRGVSTTSAVRGSQARGAVGRSTRAATTAAPVGRPRKNSQEITKKLGVVLARVDSGVVSRKIVAKTSIVPKKNATTSAITNLEKQASDLNLEKKKPTRKLTDNFECPICFESYDSAMDSLYSTLCGHIFCSKCIDEMVVKSKFCPKCRTDVDKNSVHRIYLE